MNDSEKRRKQLLNQTKNLYSDYRTPPAVHPRYANTYASLYREADGEDEVPGSLGLRILLCVLLFAAFVTLDYQGEKIADVSSSQIVDVIETDYAGIDSVL